MTDINSLSRVLDNQQITNQSNIDKPISIKVPAVSGKQVQRSRQIKLNRNNSSKLKLQKLRGTDSSDLEICFT